jgi:hypothetical protein
LGYNKKIGGDKLIIAKTTSGKYLTDRGYKIEGKKYYEDLIAEEEKIVKPTDEELIEMAKAYHPYYAKDNIIQTHQNQINEINEYEKKTDKITIDDKKKDDK